MKQPEALRLADIIDSVPFGGYTTEQMLAWGKACAAAEREACSKLCEDASTPPTGEMLTDGQWAAKVLAGKIRARGNT